MFNSLFGLEMEDITYLLGEEVLLMWFLTDFSSLIIPLSI